MDLQPVSKSLLGSGNLNGLLLYLIATFFPSVMPLISRNPKLFRIFGSALVLWPVMLGLGRLKGIWDKTSSYLISVVNISDTDDLYDFVTEWMSEKKTVRLNQTVKASLLGQSWRGRSLESCQSALPYVEENIRFEPSFGMQVFLFRRRVFWLLRSVITLERNHTTGMMHLCCLSRSTQPQKDLLEEIYLKHKREEQVSTIVRRPSPHGNYFTKVATKSVRPMDTVILEEDQKMDVLTDIEEYLKSETRDMVSRTFIEKSNRGFREEIRFESHCFPGFGGALRYLPTERGHKF